MSETVYTFPQKVLFKHCDPAGIVFYPRYFEMINDCVESFFADALDWPFETMHPDSGVPTAMTHVDFTAPSRHGDPLELRLSLTRLGRTSLGFEIRAMCLGEQRFFARATLVHVGADTRPAPWPEAIRTRLSTILEDAA